MSGNKIQPGQNTTKEASSGESKLIPLSGYAGLAGKGAGKLTPKIFWPKEE